MKNVWFLIACLMSIAIPTGVDASPMLVVTDGSLRGARGVAVNGISYDVDFRDAPCAALFSGCDEESDFAFPGDETTALAASQALLDQVFLDSPLSAIFFDTLPYLTHGCEGAGMGCQVVTPYRDIGSLGVILEVAVAFNSVSFDPLADVSYLDFLSTSERDTTTIGSLVFAVWSVSASAPSPAPEPGTLACLAIAGGALSLSRRRRRSARLEGALATAPRFRRAQPTTL